MNPPKCKETDYIDFIIATPRRITATEAAHVQPEDSESPAHDAFTRLLQRIETGCCPFLYFESALFACFNSNCVTTKIYKIYGFQYNFLYSM